MKSQKMELNSNLDLSEAEIKAVKKKGIQENLKNWEQFISYFRFYPDAFFDLIKPEVGGITLSPDQRIQLRAMARFQSVYGVQERGGGKTFVEFLFNVFCCIFYPNSDGSIASSTRENSATIISDKWSDAVAKYPLLANEIVGRPRFSKNDAEIKFINGSRITNIANSQQSKGLRRTKLTIEEAALLDQVTFDDALKPIASNARRTCGNAGVDSPEEMQRQIHFWTTTGYRASYEFKRNLLMFDSMCQCNGDFVFGNGWMTACYYERGYGVKDIIRSKIDTSPIFFAMNYSERWIGLDSSGLVDMDKLLASQVVDKPEFESDGVSEYVMAVDVARSARAGNCQSSIAVLKLNRYANNRINKMDLVYMLTLPGTMSYTNQAITVKKVKYRFNPNAVVIDNNGLGVGLSDELAKCQTDPETGEILRCWQSMNEVFPVEDERNADQCMYSFHAQGFQTNVVAYFMNAVASGRLRLLKAISSANSTKEDLTFGKEELVPYIQTKFFIDEVSNLKLVVKPSNKLDQEQNVKGVPKDRVSSVEYAIWYCMEIEDVALDNNNYDPTSYVWIG
jgi:ribonucleoside-diphosphate reductase alpha chain